MTVQEALKALGGWSPDSWCLEGMPPETREALRALSGFLHNILPRAIQQVIDSTLASSSGDSLDQLVGDGAFIKVIRNRQANDFVPAKGLPSYPGSGIIVAHGNPAPSWVGGNTSTHMLGNVAGKCVVGVRVDDADHVKGVELGPLSSANVIPAVAVSDYDKNADPPTVYVQLLQSWTGTPYGDTKTCVLPYGGSFYPNVRTGDIIAVTEDGVIEEYDLIALAGHLDLHIGAVIHTTLTGDLRAGWQQFAESRYLIGYPKSGRDMLSEGGSETHTHEPHDKYIWQHYHTVSAHTHAISGSDLYSALAHVHDMTHAHGYNGWSQIDPMAFTGTGFDWVIHWNSNYDPPTTDTYNGDTGDAKWSSAGDISTGSGGGGNTSTWEPSADVEHSEESHEYLDVVVRHIMRVD